MTAIELLSHRYDPPVVSLKSTAIKTDDTLPKATEKTHTGSVGISNSVHISFFLNEVYVSTVKMSPIFSLPQEWFWKLFYCSNNARKSLNFYNKHRMTH